MFQNWTAIVVKWYGLIFVLSNIDEGGHKFWSWIAYGYAERERHRQATYKSSCQGDHRSGVYPSSEGLSDNFVLKLGAFIFILQVL